MSAIASRDARKASELARDLGIPKSFGSYEDMLADPDIDVIYNALPNHLHVSWSIKALQAGKHVLCEKPLALNAGEVMELIRARDAAGRKVGEGFMIDTHPQWLKARELARTPEFGTLRAISGFFSFANRDPKNNRNIKAHGGGAIYDLGSYLIHGSRYMWGEEPMRVVSSLEHDPVMETDRLSSVLMEFPSGYSSVICSTQIVRYQRMQFVGSMGRIELEIPFNAPNDKECRVYFDPGDPSGASTKTFVLPVCDQYMIEIDAFSRAVLDNTQVAVPLENSLQNTRIIEAVFESARSGTWVRL
jgi:predicted dehydrogenase